MPDNNILNNPALAKNQVVSMFRLNEAEKKAYKPQVNLNEPIQDKVEIKGKEKVKKSKKGLIIAGLLGAAAVAAGVIVAVKKGVIPKLQAKMASKEAEKIAEKSKGVFEEAKNTIDEVTGLIEKGRADGFKDVIGENGNVVRRFSNGVMEELDDAGELVRKTVTESDYTNITSIDEFIGKTQNAIEISDSEISVLKGAVQTAEDSGKVKEMFIFNKDGILQGALKKLKIKNGKMHGSKAFRFNNDGSLYKFIKSSGNNTVTIDYYGGGLMDFQTKSGDKWKKIGFDENGVKRKVDKSSWEHPKYYNEKGNNITEEPFEEELEEYLDYTIQ